ncbi:hypothetical protein EI94DRAFT_839960 [Lactarius quietus]|nr:hypothetical protein EI94DRAFT_839960 [Lactarius quietus]
MLQISQYFSTRIADLGDSMYRVTHGVFAFIPFSRTRQLKFTPTTAVPASPLLDISAKVLEPSQLWSPQPSNELPSAQGFEFGSELLRITKPLVLLSLLVLLFLPFSSDLRSLISALLSLAQSFPSKFSGFVHADCREKICRTDTELAKKCSALDIALQQIERGNSRIQTLVAENGSLSSLTLDQRADIRKQSAVITQLEGQLNDQERVLLQATRLREQHEREAQVRRKEVTRLEGRISTLTAQSDMVQSMFTFNLHSAETREGQLRDSLDNAATREGRLVDTLRSKEMLLSQVQAALRTSEDTGRVQQRTLTLELETCAMQREHWKTMAEQAELRLVAADRSTLDLRKELAVAFRNVREAKEQIENQTLVIDERDATIRSLNRELAEVRGQMRDASDETNFEHTDARKPCDTEDEAESPQPDFEHTDAWKPWNAKDEIYNLQPDFEHTEPWKPLDSESNNGPPPVLEWRGLPTKDESKVPIPATQERSRHPHISLVELCSNGPTPIQVAATLPDEPLSCSTTPVIRSSSFDDPFVVTSPLKLRPTNPTFAFLSLAGSPATPVSPLGGTEMIEDLHELVAQEQLARVDTEYQLTLQQLKVLATEAVIVVQRRQLTNQHCRLSEETAKNASLREEIRNLKFENGVITARIAQSEASLAECQTARIAADKASDDSLAELAKVKAIIPVLMKEADDLKNEVDDLLNLKVERGAMMARVAHLEASLVESQTARMAASKVADDTHIELAKVKETLSVLTKEANGLRKEAHEPKKETNGLKNERRDLDVRLSQSILLSSALQERVKYLEQKAANVSSTPSDGTGSEADRSVNLVVSESVSYLLDTSMPSLSSWGSIPDPDHSLLDSRPFPLVTTKPEIRSLATAVPGRMNWSALPAKLPTTPPTASRDFDGLVTSESELSLMLAATPPDPLPTLSPVSTSTSGSPLSDVLSPCPLTSYPRPEDCPMPILGRVRKRKSSPPHTSQPYPPKGKPARRRAIF